MDGPIDKRQEVPFFYLAIRTQEKAQKKPFGSLAATWPKHIAAHATRRCQETSQVMGLTCSKPRCVLTDAYRAVPVKLLPVLYGMCMPVFGSIYRLLRPKSIR